MDWIELERRYFLQVFRRVPVVIVEGSGVRVWDERGREYLDFVGGWAVCSLGHSNPVLVEAIREQAGKLIQVSNQFYTIPQIELARLLCERSGLGKAFFANSGAEANEGAIKLARRYGEGRYEIITAKNSFHGRTLATLAATGQEKFGKPFRPLPEGFINVEYNDVSAIEDAVNERTCAVMLEPVQGEGGVIIPSPDYLRRVRELCDRKGILLILDEIQTGIGRLGELFGFEVFGVKPDIVTLGKGLGGGFPIGAFLSKDEVASSMKVGEHGSTFGGNPLATKTALTVLRFILETGLLRSVKRVGEFFLKGLKEIERDFDVVREARGMGLLLALEFEKDIADEVLKKCLDKGLLLNSPKPNIIRFMPPLIVREMEVEEALQILRETLSSI